jgi:hypothetical protein
MNKPKSTISPEEVERYFILMSQYQVSTLEIPGVISIGKPLHLPPVDASKPVEEAPNEYEQWTNMSLEDQDLELKRKLGINLGKS